MIPKLQNEQKTFFTILIVSNALQEQIYNQNTTIANNNSQKDYTNN